MNSLLIAIGFGTLLIGFYLFTYWGNNNTPRPEGCDSIAANCGGCTSNSCGTLTKS